MSEFFLELFSEEIPAGLQKNLREKLLEDFRNFFNKNRNGIDGNYLIKNELIRVETI